MEGRNRYLASATAPPPIFHNSQNDTFLYCHPVLSEIGIEPMYFQVTLELSTYISQSPFTSRSFMSQNCTALAKLNLLVEVVA